MQVLDERQAGLVRSVCEAIVPGCARTGAEVYVDALLAHMPDVDREHALAAFEALAEPAAAGRGSSASDALTPEFQLVRALACEAYYSDFVAAGRARSRRLAGDRLRLSAGHPAEQGLVVPGGRRMSVSQRFDVVVVGSGAGGGVVAGELADAGVSVLLLESGPHKTAADFTRWEAHANHELWWPPAFAEPPAPDEPPLIVFRGHCVGGTTSINTKVALRPSAQDYEKWHRAGGLLGDGGEPFSEADLLPHIERTEQRLGVRERSDWQQCIKTVVPGFAALDAELEPVISYTDSNCMRCGSCLQGCPDQRRQVDAQHLHPPAMGRRAPRAAGRLSRPAGGDRGPRLRARGRRACSYADGEGAAHQVEADVVVVAGGAMASPQLLLRSGVRQAAGGSPSAEQIGRHLGFHPARLVEGLFDEVQDAHMVYPISAHCMKFQRDEDGGFVVEAATIQDPIGFATALSDENGIPLWGEELTRGGAPLPPLHRPADHGQRREPRHRLGRRRGPRPLLVSSGATPSASGSTTRFSSRGACCRRPGAKRVYQTGVLSTHVQGGCRMGTDPARSVVDAHGESHDIRRLFVGDGSVIPRTLSVNPSLTIMSLASRLAQYLACGEHGYFAPAAAIRAVA